jgi:hypothetical protein
MLTKELGEVDNKEKMGKFKDQMDGLNGYFTNITNELSGPNTEWLLDEWKEALEKLNQAMLKEQKNYDLQQTSKERRTTERKQKLKEKEKQQTPELVLNKEEEDVLKTGYLAGLLVDFKRPELDKKIIENREKYANVDERVFRALISLSKDDDLKADLELLLEGYLSFQIQPTQVEEEEEEEEVEDEDVIYTKQTAPVEDLNDEEREMMELPFFGGNITTNFFGNFTKFIIENRTKYEDVYERGLQAAVAVTADDEKFKELNEDYKLLLTEHLKK